jgi:copper chaperone CopZ
MVMKINSLLIILLSVIIFSACESKNEEHTQTAQFKVFGNCDMCKKRIESSIKEQKGVASVEWNVDNKMVKVQYDSTVAVDDLHKKIAAAGHDTELMTANEDAYKALHVCCQYKRKQ